MRDPLDVIAEICHAQPPDALEKIAQALGFPPADETPPLPDTPPPLYIHPKLGETFDRFQMQQYAMKYRFDPRRTTAVRGVPERYEPIGRYFMRDGEWVKAAPESPVGETLYRRTDCVGASDTKVNAHQTPVPGRDEPA